MTTPLHSRRGFLSLAGGGAGLLLAAPGLVLAQAATERRFVFIIQRGAADGLDTVIPYADPDYARLRGAMAIDTAAATRLDALFALHPSLVETAKLFAAKEALFAHAVASPYRERSHFDGQNVLESGGANAHEIKDGWLNRLVTLLPKNQADAIAITPTVPLALRGRAEVASYAPSMQRQAAEDFLERVQQMYAKDTQLHGLMSSAMDTRGMAGAPVRQNPAELGQLAARFLSQARGPRIAMLETGGWDTHSAQGPRLANQLKSLDAMIAALRDGLGAAWATSTVLVATEFGRTAAINGTGGTDHGTAAAAMVLGGAVQGGRVLADWPGLSAKALFQGRDLQPTLGLDTLISSVAGECFGLDPERLGRTLFPRPAAAGATPAVALPRLLRS